MDAGPLQSVSPECHLITSSSESNLEKWGLVEVRASNSPPAWLWHFVSLPGDIFLRYPCILDSRCRSPYYALVRTWPQSPHQSRISSPQRLKFRQGAKPETGDMYTPRPPPLQQCVTVLISRPQVCWQHGTAADGQPAQVSSQRDLPHQRAPSRG